MMYANDTCLTGCSMHDLDSLEMQLNNDLNKAQLRLQENKHTANAKKKQQSTLLLLAKTSLIMG